MQFLRMMSVFLPVLYILHIVRSSLQGLGDTVFPLLSGLAELIMRVGAALFLPVYLGYEAVFIGEVLAWAGADAILLSRYWRAAAVSRPSTASRRSRKRYDNFALEVMGHMLRYRIGRCLDAVAAPIRRILPHHVHREIDMVNGHVFSNVVRYSIPLILSGMLQLLYNMADVIVVGKFENPEAVAAVGATSSLITLMVNLFIGLSVGTSVLVAQFTGAGKYREVQDTVHTSITLSLVMGVLVGIFGLLMSHTFLVWMGTPEGNVLEGASLYMRIYFLGMPGNMLYNFGAAIMRSVGDTKRPLYYLTLAGVINIILNIVTVAFFGMGVAGVALATITSQYISAILVLLNLIRSHGSVHLDLKQLRIKARILGGIMKIGLPAGFSSIIFSISTC